VKVVKICCFYHYKCHYLIRFQFSIFVKLYTKVQTHLLVPSINSIGVLFLLYLCCPLSKSTFKLKSVSVTVSQIVQQNSYAVMQQLSPKLA